MWAGRRKVESLSRQWQVDYHSNHTLAQAFLLGLWPCLLSLWVAGVHAPQISPQDRRDPSKVTCWQKRMLTPFLSMVSAVAQGTQILYLYQIQRGSMGLGGKTEPPRWGIAVRCVETEGTATRTARETGTPPKPGANLVVRP